MTEGRSREEWNQTSQILATLININRKPGSPAVRPRDLNPFLQKRASRASRRISDPAALASEFGTKVTVN